MILLNDIFELDACAPTHRMTQLPLPHCLQEEPEHLKPDLPSLMTVAISTAGELAPALSDELQEACACAAMSWLFGLSFRPSAEGRFKAAFGGERAGAWVAECSALFWQLERARSRRRRIYLGRAIPLAATPGMLQALKAVPRSTLQAWARRYLCDQASELDTDTLAELLSRIRPVPRLLVRRVARDLRPPLFSSLLPSSPDMQSAISGIVQRLYHCWVKRFSYYRPRLREHSIWRRDSARVSAVVRELPNASIAWLAQWAMYPSAVVEASLARARTSCDEALRVLSSGREEYLAANRPAKLFVPYQCAACREVATPDLRNPDDAPPFAPGCSCLHVEWAPENLADVSQHSRRAENANWRWRRFIVIELLRTTVLGSEVGPASDMLEAEDARQRRYGRPRVERA